MERREAAFWEENVLGNSFPDVDYSHGLIELKYVEDWGKRRQAAHVDYEFGQAAVLVRRWRAGGLSWVLVGIGEEVFLVSGFDAATVGAPLLREEWLDLACWHTVWPPTAADHERLLAWLRGRFGRLSLADQALLTRLRCLTRREAAACSIANASGERWSVERVTAAEKGRSDTDAAKLLDYFNT